MLTSEKQLTLHYQVDEPVQLEVIITTISGIVLYHQPVHTVSNGIYTEQVNLAGQGENEFVTRFPSDRLDEVEFKDAD